MKEGDVYNPLIQRHFINLLALKHASFVSCGLLLPVAEEDLALFMRIEAILYPPHPCNIIIRKHGMYLQCQIIGMHRVNQDTATDSNR